MSLKICEENHAPMCHDGDVCPACEIIEDRDSTIRDMETEVNRVRLEIINERGRNTDLQEQISRLQNDLRIANSGS